MNESDPTTQLILDAALATFGTRGFAATSLTEIAATAKVSRPTLYARYPDKVHLFRAVLQGCYDEALTAAAGAAKDGGDFEEALTGLLFGYYGTLFDRFHGLPLIDELVLVQSEEAEDIVQEARQRFHKCLVRTLRNKIGEGAVDADRMPMPVSQLADLIRAAPSSLKTPATTRSQYRRGLANFARLVAQAIA